MKDRKSGAEARDVSAKRGVWRLAVRLVTA